MTSDTTNPIGEGTPAIFPADFQSLDLIRTETVFSKYPRHILSKSGLRPEIRLEKSSPVGKLEFRWYVSYSDTYGKAGQLAYDLDTLVIERAIEEAFEESRHSGSPLPRLIPIGSLTDICQKLGMADAGTNLKKIKRALQQNALTGITAFLKYRGNDGSEQWIDATFTCYGVIFTGRKLPDGRKAEQTYISTTNEYHHVLSTAPTRPLDYTYMKQLPPTARRLYELLSFPMYGALKNNQPVAKLLYSDYCARAPHIRYFTFDQVKKQMFKVNKPHKSSGYIDGVHYDKAVDEQGQPDWLMCFKPGPKARAEYATVTGKRPRVVETGKTTSALPAGESGKRQNRPRQRRLNLAPSIEPQPARIIDYNTVAELSKRGLGDIDARALLASLPPGQPVLEQLEYLDFQINQAKGTRGEIRNAPGFYIDRLRANIPVPATFETSVTRKARQEAESAQRETIQKERESELAAWEAERKNRDSVIGGLTEPDRHALFAAAKASLIARRPAMAAFFKQRPDTAIEDGAVRNEMYRLLTEGWKPHYAINPAIRQATPLQETAPLQPVAEPPQAVNPVANLEAILSTPQLSPPSVEQGSVKPAPAQTSPVKTEPQS